MRKIIKGNEPTSLTQWKRGNPTGRYDDIDMPLRQDIRNACLKEQFYLCAYCCKAITGNNYDCMNEHVEARKLAQHRSLDYYNIVTSCTTKNQCDDSHGSQPFSLTPLMDECETELLFKISGRVEGLTDRARQAISVLRLGDSEQQNRSLIQTRKQLVDALLFANGIDPSDGLDDDELLKSVIDDINQPVDGKLKPFAPVVANILRSWLSITP